MNKTLNNFKKDPTPRHYGGAGGYEEPTRDPEVWPPPTPVEREKRWACLLLSLSYTSQSYHS